MLKEYKETDNKKNFSTFVCHNKQSIKEEMRKKFPALKFKQKNFLYTFTLTYDDLFREKGDKIYFLIYFTSTITLSWEMGYPFMKKYLFNYNYDNKVVSFYHSYLRDDANEENFRGYFNKGKIFVIIVLVVIIAILGYCIGLKFRNKKKLSAKELESQFNLNPPLFEKDDKF